jgi:hypothetical protein
MDEHLEPQPPNAESGPEGRVRRCRAAEGGGLRRPGHGSPRQPVKNPARDEPRRGSEGPPKSVRVKRAGSTGFRRSGESPILAEVCRRSIGIENFARDKCHVDVWLFRIASDRRGDGRRRRPQLSTGGVVHRIWRGGVHLWSSLPRGDVDEKLPECASGHDCSGEHHCCVAHAGTTDAAAGAGRMPRFLATVVGLVIFTVRRLAWCAWC